MSMPTYADRHGGIAGIVPLSLYATTLDDGVSCEIRTH